MIFAVVITLQSKKEGKDKTILQMHLKKHKDPAYECKNCMQYISTGAELATHHEAKYKEKDELCTVCGKRFTKKAHLHEHQRGGGGS